MRASSGPPMPAACCTTSSARAPRCWPGKLAETEAAAYLSGILIGNEVRAAMDGRQGEVVHVIGAPDLTALYARAISAFGGFPERHDGEAAARGLALIAGHASWN